MGTETDSKDQVLRKSTTWVVFGDDWGAHPSTTQHLILNMPGDNSAVWIDSIGMRAPRINLMDLRRIISKTGSMFNAGTIETNRLYEGTVGKITRIKPRVLPWHQMPIVVKYNRRWLGKEVPAAMPQNRNEHRILMAANPVAAYYGDVIPHDKLVYLRLDDYSEYPGCDPELVADSEAKIYEQADIIVATARNLLPAEPFTHKGRYLPQGVQTNAFAGVPIEPPRKPVLGFFGSIARWLDFDLIDSVSRQAPEWQLEFIGNPDYVPRSMQEQDNITILPPVPFGELWRSVSHWAAAWIPFKINELTIGVNPLKVREYLAAGLPTHCTPLPEMRDLNEQIFVASDAGQIVTWLRKSLRDDSVELRRKRRLGIENESWHARASALMAMVGNTD